MEEADATRSVFCWKKKDVKSLTFVCWRWAVAENDCSAFWKASGTQEVGHMDMQQLEKCITLPTSDVFIQLHLNIIPTVSQYENIATCHLIPITT